MNKPPMYRLSTFYETLADVVEILEFGEEKHKDNENWRTYPLEKDLDAAMRHIMKHRNEPIDNGEGGSGKLHIANAICRLLFAHEKFKQN